MNKILVLCTGNSCRSIIAEAQINAFLDNFKAYSAGVNPSKNVNKSAKKVLEKHGIWKEEYHSKDIDKIAHIKFDLVVTVCDNAKESCPSFSQNTKVLHVGFCDPDGLDYKEFEKTYNEIKNKLLPKIKKAFYVEK